MNDYSLSTDSPGVFTPELLRTRFKTNLRRRWYWTFRIPSPTGPFRVAEGWAPTKFQARRRWERAADAHLRKVAGDEQ